jgi:hypothetical protein
MFFETIAETEIGFQGIHEILAVRAGNMHGRRARHSLGPSGLHADNGGDHPARAVDSTQIKTADRGLGVHRFVIALFYW